MRDVFQPTTEPARSIYAAFQAEAKKRESRSVEEWTSAEVDAVHREAVYQAQAHGLRAPSKEEIERAERYAMGSVDYGAKWAYSVVDAMRRANDAQE
ncbi:TPA: hypothetical protein ACLG1D_001178 [Pseudomonas aeruginosa]|uniref:Uncharacterized protein n=1 Tax=Ectopseudomonas oleovorans TaxID=301 RepID=A0A379JZQ9_ECTOL|nr:hypothetical protein [Pseudomonas oleovorans]SUD57930.1 Uncharacterised protein [Pseudomonas oleovorans]